MSPTTNTETTTDPQTDRPQPNESQSNESQPDEARSAGSIVADLIQELNAGEPQPKAGETADEAAGESGSETAGDIADETVDESGEETASESGGGAAAGEAGDVAAGEAGDVTAGAAAGVAAGEPEALIELEVDPGAIEAILLVVDEPLTAITLATVLDRPEPAVAEALRGLAMAYDAEQRGFDLREVAGGWRLYTREEYAEVVEKFVLDGQQAKLTQASLETLAVVAYRQPVSRSRVSAIRGVNCDGVMRTLIARGLIVETGVEGESGATLYSTTSYFLERLGLNSLDELPDLAPYLPELDEIEDVIHAESALPPPAGEHDPDDTDEKPPHQEPDEQ